MGRLTALQPRVGGIAPKLAPATTATERITGSSLQVIRRRILSRDCGVCQCAECKQQGRVLPATEVDHIIPLWAGGLESDDNRMSMSTDCHARKTAREAAMRARGERPGAPCPHGGVNLTDR